MKEEKYESKVAWRTVGVDNWKKSTEKIKEHKKTEAHMVSMVRWSNFKQRPLEEAFRRADIEDITLYLARQDGGFRGLDESRTSLNKGNFLELVQLLAKYDSTLKRYLDDINHIQSQKKKTQMSLLSYNTQKTLSRPLPPMSEESFSKK
jgi:hypothetical protein